MSEQPTREGDAATRPYSDDEGWRLVVEEIHPRDLTRYMQSASAYTSLRVELAHIFGPVTPREGQTWNEAMLARITEKLVERGI